MAHVRVVGWRLDLVEMIVRAVLVNSYAIWILFVLWTISNGYGMYIARGIPADSI
jgi:hypothetical protein